MPTSLTGSTVASTYDQLLHINDGPTSTLKSVYSGTGVETALKVSTAAAGVGNLEFSGNAISTTDTNGNLSLTPNGTGAVAIAKVAITGGSITGITPLAIAEGGTNASTASGARTALELGTIATQDADDVTITGGAISGVSFSGSFTGATSIDCGTYTTDDTDAGLTITSNSITADGDDTNIDIDVTPKGTGTTNITNVNLLNVSTVHAYGIFYDLSDQTFSVDTPTEIEFDTTGIADEISVASSTQITFATAGTYEISCRLQFQNVDNADHVADIWFRLNGTDILYSASKISVPKAADGGKICHSITGILVVTASQYLEVVVAVEDADVSLHHEGPLTDPPDAYDRPDVPSAIIVARRLV